MLSKLLEEVGKKLLTVLEKRPYGVTLIVVIGAVGAAFFFLHYLRSTPTAVETLRDPLFLSVTICALAVGAIVVLKQCSVLGRRSSIAVSLAVACSTAITLWAVYQDNTPTFKIDVVLDETADLDPTLLAAFLTDAQQPHIRITLLSRRFTSTDPSPTMLFEKVETEAAPHLRMRSEATHTILVTNKVLSNNQWANLFYSSRDRFGVISTNGVIEPENANDSVLARRYLASMIPLAAMHATAAAQRATFLPDRSDATEHGCLHDFSVDRRLLIEKLRRGPRLCDAESRGLTDLFGNKLIAEYKAILEQSAR